MSSTKWLQSKQTKRVTDASMVLWLWTSFTNPQSWHFPTATTPPYLILTSYAFRYPPVYSRETVEIEGAPRYGTFPLVHFDC